MSDCPDCFFTTIISIVLVLFSLSTFLFGSGSLDLIFYFIASLLQQLPLHLYFCKHLLLIWTQKQALVFVIGFEWLYLGTDQLVFPADRLELGLQYL